jgi:hypothetical protein
VCSEMNRFKNNWSKNTLIRCVIFVVALLVLVAGAALPGSSESDPDLETFFQKNIGLSQDQIAAIRKGKPITKVLPSRIPAEVFLFGAVYIHGSPESYAKFANDFDRLRKLPNYLALGVLSTPPQLSDFKDLSVDSEDIQALKRCEPGNCLIQMPAGSIEEVHRSIDWSAADVNEQVDQLLRKTVLRRLLNYEREGNQALGDYDDKREKVDVSQQFAFMLSYNKVLPQRLPDFYNYLLTYPNAKPANVEDTFYWARVKFGLKPTLRVVQVVTMTGKAADRVAYAVAEKQLYASHYFETALDLSFCLRDNDNPKRPGFYLIMLLSSEQAGLTGVKGSIVRKVAVGRSVSNLQDALETIKNTLESEGGGY